MCGRFSTSRSGFLQFSSGLCPPARDLGHSPEGIERLLGGQSHFRKSGGIAAGKIPYIAPLARLNNPYYPVRFPRFLDPIIGSLHHLGFFLSLRLISPAVASNSDLKVG